MKIKQFACFKVEEKKSDKAPDYRLSARAIVNGEDKYIDIGAGWKKTTKDGKNNFISFSLSEAYMDRPGFNITEDLDVTEPVGDLKDF
jgi:uncharacterized protein (DUF736 family)